MRLAGMCLGIAEGLNYNLSECLYRAMNLFLTTALKVPRFTDDLLIIKLIL